MGTRAQNFRRGTSAFCHVNVTKIGTGAEKLNVPRLSHEVVSARLASGAVPKFRKKFKMCSTWSMRKKNCPLPNMAASGEKLQLAKNKKRTK
jgi:hypothetical protein